MFAALNTAFFLYFVFAYILPEVRNVGDLKLYIPRLSGEESHGA
jgi:hypothetical protein